MSDYDNDTLHGEMIQRKMEDHSHFTTGQNFLTWSKVLRNMLFDVPLRKRDITYLEEMEEFFKHGNLKDQ